MSIIIQEHRCLNCNGPLGPATSSYSKCPYCESDFYLGPLPGFRIPEDRGYRHAPGLGIVAVGDDLYRVHGRLAQGRHSDVFLARRERAMTEMVIIKVARDGCEEGLRREWEALAQVRAAHEFIRHLTATPIAFKTARCSGYAERLAAVYRWRSGFSFTLLDARAEYPDGVDPRATVWMWNRLLDQLTCLHDVGFSHNALLPEHLLLHPRDHGLALCGWSEAQKGEGDDLAQSGACIASLLGSTAPKALRDLTLRSGRCRDAIELKLKLREIAEAAFGPPRFHPFALGQS